MPVLSSSPELVKGYEFFNPEAIMPMTVRPATAADAALICDFNRRMALETENKVLDPPVLAAGVAAVFADPAKGVYYLAEDSGAVVGQAMLTFEWSDWRNGWIWWFQSVYVRSESRRRGVFRVLYEHVYQAAQADASVIGLRLYVEPNNRTAQETYRRLGMAPAGYLMYQRYPL